MFLDRPAWPKQRSGQPCESDHPLLQDKSSSIPQAKAKERPADKITQKFVDPLSAFGLDPLSVSSQDPLLDEAERKTDEGLSLTSRYVIPPPSPKCLLM